MAIDGRSDDGSGSWQVVKKKGRKAQMPDYAEALEGAASSPLPKKLNMPKDQASLPGSPSLRSSRSGASTNSTTADEAAELPLSPCVESICSDHSTDVLLVANLDESTMPEDAQSIQLSSSTASLDAAGTHTVSAECPSSGLSGVSLGAYATAANRQAVLGNAPTSHLSEALLDAALKRAQQTEPLCASKRHHQAAGVARKGSAKTSKTHDAAAVVQAESAPSQGETAKMPATKVPAAKASAKAGAKVTAKAPAKTSAKAPSAKLPAPKVPANSAVEKESLKHAPAESPLAGMAPGANAETVDRPATDAVKGKAAAAMVPAVEAPAAKAPAKEVQATRKPLPRMPATKPPPPPQTPLNPPPRRAPALDAPVAPVAEATPLTAPPSAPPTAPPAVPPKAPPKAPLSATPTTSLAAPAAVTPRKTKRKRKEIRGEAKDPIAVEVEEAKIIQQNEGVSEGADSSDAWPSLGSAWLHNGRRDELAAWRLVTFEPLWQVRQSSIPQIPVSVQAVNAGAHVIIRKTFLSFEPEFKYSDATCRRRARSLNAILHVRSKI